MAGEARPGIHRLVKVSAAWAGGFRIPARINRRVLFVAVLVGSLTAGACAGSSPEVPLGPDGQPDQVLLTGREIYGSNCVTCHGAEGQGGRGKRLNDNQVIEAYADPADMLAVIAEGKGSGMPAFAEKLDESERIAVGRYIREVLN